MKCVMNNESKEIRRVAEDIATNLVSTNRWKFIGKELWKKEVRNLTKIVPLTVETLSTIEDTTQRQRKIDERKAKKEYQKKRRERTITNGNNVY